MKAISYRFGIVKSIEFFLKIIILNMIISTMFSGLFHMFKLSSFHPLVNTISMILSLVISIKTTVELKNWSIYDELNFENGSLILLLPFSFIIIGVSILLLDIRNYLFYYFPMSVFFEKIFMQVSGANISLFWSVVSILIFIPIVNEVIFRGVILNGIKNKYYSTTAVVFSSILFGLITFNIYEAIPTFVLGIIIGLVYINTNSLGLAILLHMFSNLITLIYLYLLELEISVYINGDFHSIWLNGFAIINIMIGLAIYKKKFKSHHKVSRNRWA